jgi:acetylornithine/N-succinyldiaminopimelate aminotransferase
MPSNNQSQFYRDIDKKHYLQTFKRYPQVFERGNGVYLWDKEGKTYLDALAGIAVNILGHNHPALVNAIKAQAEMLIHISNFYLSEPQALLTEKLSQLSGLQRVFLTNSGAESNEGALKIARKYAHSVGRGGNVISFKGSFHGRTLATIATGKKKMQQGFDPIPQGFKQVAFNDMEAVKKAADKNTAAIIIEPVQGEGGINPADPKFMKDLRKFCTQENIVLIFDEIQCGICRTGKFFAKEHFGVQPDIMTLAKALGGGVPIGAILTDEKIAQAMDYGDHGTTFGGNPLASAAALAVLETAQKKDLSKQAEEKGKWFVEKIKSFNLSSIKEIRGKGLMIGIVFDFETKPLVAEMLQRGVLANATADNVLRIVPPLIINYPELEKIAEVIKESVNNL